MMVTGIALLMFTTTLMASGWPSGAREPEYEIGAFHIAKTVCDGNGGFEWVWMQKPQAYDACFILHEKDHIEWFKTFLPGACQGRARGANPALNADDKQFTECHAFRSSLQCLIRMKATDRCAANEAFLNENIGFHERAIEDYCGTMIQIGIH